LSDRFAALVAALLAALLVASVAWAAPELIGDSASPEGQVLAGRSSPTPDFHDKVPMPSRSPAATTNVAPVITGVASNYAGTAGFIGKPVVALPGAMGGRYNGQVQGTVTVCADRCVRLAVVDWCECYWGSDRQRVADISRAAWPLITDKPLSSGLVRVRVILDDPRLSAVWRSR
jgi:hypothetical protein